jgi:hypothetical protein
MSHDYELAVSASISATVAEDMIRHIVEDQTGKKIASVQAEFKDSKFQGFRIMFEKEQPCTNIRNNPSASDRSFRLATYS